MGRVFSFVLGSILVVLGIVVVLLVIGLYFSPDSSFGNLINNFEDADESSSKKIDVSLSPDDETNGNTGGGTNMGEGAGGESGGSEQGSSTTSGCQNQQISYSLKNFERNETCNVVSQGNCVDKNLDCSVDVQNLDSSLTGEFVISFEFFNYQDELIDTVTDSAVMVPRETKNMQASIQVTGEDANHGLDCSFNVVETPTKEVCF